MKTIAPARFLPSLFLLSALSCAAQNGGIVEARQFPGADVGAKVANAQAQCSQDPSASCTIVIDQGLAALPAGTMPALCAHCFLQDYRYGAAWHTGKLNVLDLGIDGSGRTDTTTAFLNAIATAFSHSDFRSAIGNPQPLYFPSGIYRIHEANISAAHGGLMLEGSAGIGGSQIFYGGSGGAGSYLLQTGPVVYGGLQNFILHGVNPEYQSTTTTMAQNAIVMEGKGADFDAAATLSDFQIKDFYGNAITVGSTATPGEIINGWIHHFRTDGVGGYTLHFQGKNNANGNPVHMYDYTVASWLSKAAAAYGIAQGYIEGSGSTPSSYGAGEVYCDSCGGNIFHIEDARDEENLPLKNIGNADEGVFFSANDSSAGYPAILYDNFAMAGVAAAPHSLVSTATGKVPVTLIGTNDLQQISGIYKNRATQREYGDQSQAAGVFWSFGRNPAQFQGYCLEGQCFDVIPKANMTNNYAPRQIGDWFFVHQTDFVPGTMGPFNVVVSPSSGRASLDAALSIAKNGTLAANSSGGANLTGFNPLYPANHLGIHLGDNLTLPNSGGGGRGNSAVTVTCIDAVGSGAQCAGLSTQGFVITPAPACMKAGPCPSAGAVAIDWTQAQTSNFGLEANRTASTSLAGTRCPYAGDYLWIDKPKPGLTMGYGCSSDLLWIAMPSYPGGNTATGIATANPSPAIAAKIAPATSDASAFSEQNSNPGFLKGFVEQASCCGPSSTLNTQGDIFTACDSATASTSDAGAAQPFVLQSTSAAIQGNCAGWAGSRIYYAGRHPLVTLGVAYSAAADYSSNARIWLGVAASDCPPSTMAASDMPACSFAAIRYSTAAGDNSYQCVTGNGSSTTVTSIGVAPATSLTAMSIAIGAGGVTCTVNGTGVTNATTLPDSSAVLYDLLENSTLTARATHLRLNGIYGVSQDGSY